MEGVVAGGEGGRGRDGVSSSVASPTVISGSPPDPLVSVVESMTPSSSPSNGTGN